MSILSGVLLGLLIGLRHAFEPDHLAAVSTMVPETHSVRRGAMLGALWGLGHTLALTAVALLLVLVGGELSERTGSWFEFCVALMLVGLGVRSVVRALRVGGQGREQSHQHGTRHHVHETSARHVHVAGRALAVRPLLVGTMHGLAGSGALTIAVAAELPTAGSRLAYVLVFGLGSMIGMAIVSGFGTLLLGAVDDRWQRRVQLTFGAVSMVVGVWWGVPLLSAL